MARTFMHGVGALTMTVFAFGVGPAIGMAGLTAPYEVTVVSAPVEGAPMGSLDLASFALELAPMAELADDSGEQEQDRAEVDEAEPIEEAEPVEAAEVAKAPPMPAKAPVEPTAKPIPAPEPNQARSVLQMAAAGERPTARPKGRPCKTPTPNPKIERTALGEFSVDRSLVSFYLTHLGELNRLGWSSRHKDDSGKSVGMRIGGVRCGNDLHLAGIRAGDVVHRVNGREVRSIPEAIWVYQRERKADIVEVELTRRGKLHTLRYRIS